MDFCFQKDVDPFMMDRKNCCQRIRVPSGPSARKARACQGGHVLLSSVDDLSMALTVEARINLVLVFAE